MMHQDVALQRYCFQKLPSADVPVELRDRANDVVAFVSTDLGIAPPEVIWIQPSSPTATTDALGHFPQLYPDHIHPRFARVPDDIRGGYTPRWQQPRQIWLRRELHLRAVEFVAAHETRHVWQKETDMKLFEDECRAECDAYPYGYDVLKRYLASKGRLDPEVVAEIDAKREAKRSAFALHWPNGRFEAIDHKSPNR